MTHPMEKSVHIYIETGESFGKLRTMRFAVFLLMLFLVPAMAHGDGKEVPNPIPADFNECVRVIVSDKGREHGADARMATWEPPLTRKDHALLEYYRREGWGKLILCDSKQS